MVIIIFSYFVRAKPVSKVVNYFVLPFIMILKEKLIVR